MASTSSQSAPIAESAIRARRSSAARLVAVGLSRLADSEPEDVFDGTVQVAADLTRAPAAFLAVILEDRDYFKSHVGFEGELARTRTLRGRTFCHHVLCDRGPVVVNDTHSEPDFADVPTVDSLGIRAYLGVPVHYASEMIGSLCAVDMEPRTWSEAEVNAMVHLAGSVERELESRRLLSAVRNENRALRAQAQAQNKVLSGLMQAMRTPLQVLKLALDVHGDSAPTFLATMRPRMQRSVDTLEELVVKMAPAVRDVMGRDLERLPMRAATLASDTYGIMQAAAVREGAKLDVRTMSQAKVTVDYGLMLRALCEVVGNAIQHGQQGTQVVLSVDECVNEVLVHVYDNGPGFSASELASALEMPFDGKSLAARRGLVRVREALEAHEGSVLIESRPGVGSTVTLRLPRTR